MQPDYDLLIIGAGISGISAAVHATQMCPEQSFTVLEARHTIGGTWDLFKYPGIRSDSDMHTFGFRFKPWKNPKAIADADSILAYLTETVEEYGLGDKIQFGHKMLSASWSTPDAMWSVRVQTDGGMKTVTCRFLFSCSGYYSYTDPHNPDIAGQANFKGPILHPQDWDEGLDYAGKRVIVIGSGATAVTLVPAMAETAKHVTMLQRTPSYIVSRPQKDGIANILTKILPDMWAYNLTRAKNEWMQNFVYQASVRNPERVKKNIFKMTRKSLGQPKDYNLDPNFIPPYNPWEQRLCLVPDNDMFEAIKSGKASIVTDHVDAITETGIQLKSGQHLDCDIIVKATGINVIVLSNTQFDIDGAPVDFSKTYTYEGFMFSGVPNLASTFGYVNASWTLRADLISEYVCRIMNHMGATGTRQAIPRAPNDMTGRPWITTFNPGYINRVLDQLPMQGDHEPWINTQNYKRDKKVLPRKPLDDGYMEFSNPTLGKPAYKHTVRSE